MRINQPKTYWITAYDADFPKIILPGDTDDETLMQSYKRRNHPLQKVIAYGEFEKLKVVLKSIRVQAVVNGIEGHEDVVNRINEALNE